MLFVWTSVWLFMAIHLLAGGDLWFSWYRGGTRILVQRDTHPNYFWFCVILFFLLAIVGAWAGIVELRRFIFIPSLQPWDDDAGFASTHDFKTEMMTFKRPRYGPHQLPQEGALTPSTTT